MIEIPSVAFSGLAFTPSAVTLACPVEPAEYEVQETDNGITARVTRCVIGDSDQDYDGSMVLRAWREADGTLCWQAEAEMPDPIKGVRVEIEPLACERVHTPTGREAWEVTDDQAFCGQFPYPRNNGAFVWAQCLFLEGTEGIWMLRSEDHPPRYQRYRVERMDGGCRLVTYLEPLAFARRPACTTPAWRLEQVPDLVSGAQKHAAWMAHSYGWRPLEQRGDIAPWLLDISLCVHATCCSGYGSITMTFAQLEKRLHQIAQQLDPHHTLLQLVGWDGLLDWRHPDYEPDPRLGGNIGFQKLMQTAHDLGFRVGTHLNIHALGTRNPQFEELKHFLAHEVRDSSGIPLFGQWDLNGDGVAENNRIFISPDHEPWRVYQRARILKHVRDFGVDAVYLDQSSNDFNDTQHWHWRGTCALVEGLRAVLPPEVVIAGKDSSELHTHLIPLCCDKTGNGVPELFSALFGPYVKAFEPGYPPVDSPSAWAYERTRKSTWRKEDFYSNLETIEKADLVPTLRLNNAACPVDDNKEAMAIYDAARRYRARHVK